MLGLSHLGIIHTLISLVAVGAGIVSFVRYGSISMRTQVGRIFVWTTILTCLTGFPIFRFGVWGPAHTVGVLTLVVLGFAILVEKRAVLGSISRAVETVSYTTTFLFHMIPAVVETTTRLPPSAPLASGPNDLLVQGMLGIVFVAYLAGAVLQVIRLKAVAPVRS